MASDLPEVDSGESGEAGPASDGAIAAAAGVAAMAACLSCGARIVGAFCATCGQKNDDMRRSSFVLFKDFVKDTFAFDSRMWRTLGLMAAAPGRVPANYSHGRRSRYTPPVRLFLVVSFLFFLTLGFTQTMFVALEVKAKTPAEIAAGKAARELALKEAGPELGARIEEGETQIAVGGELIEVDGEKVDCDIHVGFRFFVRPQDLHADRDAWRRCSKSVAEAARKEADEEVGAQAKAEDGTEKVLSIFERALGGVGVAVEDPVRFNADINAWLPRVMFLMTPILALIMTMFFRGKDALLFDHLVLSFYSHAAAFAIIGMTIIAGQFGAPHLLPAAMVALAVYLTLALKRAYGRGWIKTIYSSGMIGFLYTIILSIFVMSFMSRQIWAQGA